MIGQCELGRIECGGTELGWVVVPPLPIPETGFLMENYAGMAYLGLGGKLESISNVINLFTGDAFVEIQDQEVGYLTDEFSSYSYILGGSSVLLSTGFLMLNKAGAAYLCLNGKFESDGIIRIDVTDDAYVDKNKAFQNVGYLVDEVRSDINI
jgi:hypothetical protein